MASKRSSDIIVELDTSSLQSLSVLLDNVNCDNNQTDLFLCQHDGWNNHNCGHSEDIFLYCTEGK